MTKRRNIHRQACLTLAFLVLGTANASAKDQDYKAVSPPAWIAEEIPLQDTPAAATEIWFTADPQSDGAPMVRNVTRPTLTPILPRAASARGTAVIVLPGGALYMLSIEEEGLKVAHALADAGIAAFVLKYRLEATPDDPQVFWQRFDARVGHPGRNADTYAPEAKAAEDLEAALRLVRARAAEWSIDPQRICVLGFSSGANVALAATLADLPDARPDFLAFVYGSMETRKVPADAPPLFAAIAGDDPIFGREPFDLVRDWRAAGRSAELHLYDRGGHGFGLRKQNFTSDRWLDEFLWWLEQQK